MLTNPHIPSRGILCDCEIFAHVRLKLYFLVTLECMVALHCHCLTVALYLCHVWCMNRDVNVSTSGRQLLLEWSGVLGAGGPGSGGGILACISGLCAHIGQWSPHWCPHRPVVPTLCSLDTGHQEIRRGGAAPPLILPLYAVSIMGCCLPCLIKYFPCVASTFYSMGPQSTSTPIGNIQYTRKKLIFGQNWVKNITFP